MNRHDRLLQSYYRLVCEGKITLEQVPVEFREEVREMIENEVVD